MQEEHEGWADPDRDTSAQASVTGGAGTYNHLSDAILDIAATREMYMRRLQTLTDRFLVGGDQSLLGQMATSINNEMATSM
eukprot:gene18044-24461_t